MLITHFEVPMLVFHLEVEDLNKDEQRKQFKAKRFM